MNEETQNETAIYWLAAVTIVYNVDGGLERQRPINVMVKTFNPFINVTVLGNLQASAQAQAINEKKIPRKAKIIDAIITGLCMLGEMTQDQYLKATASQEAFGEQEQPSN